MFNLRSSVLVGLALTTLCLSGMSSRKPVSAPPINPPNVTVRYRYYPITGTTMQALRSQMSQRGPIDRLSGKRYDANTDWTVTWQFRYHTNGNQCAIQSAGSKVAVTITLPQWKPPARVERSLVTEWNRYLSALHIHEDGHKNNGIAAASDVVKTLRQLPPAATCQHLSATASNAAKRVIQHYNRKDGKYDAVTHHGFTQGAVFPPATTASQQRSFRN